MPDIHTIRRRAEDARRLSDDPVLREILSEIEAEATRLFLASGGNPASLTAAFEKARAVQTLRAALETRFADQTVADKRERKRAGHD